MKFIVKLSPEITIKSESVRLRFIKILTSNIRNIIKKHLDDVAVLRRWDHIIVTPKIIGTETQIRTLLTRIPGIHHILLVDEVPFNDLHHIFEKTLAIFQHQLEHKTFCVRVKRKGTHEFTSIDVERYVGGGLNQAVESAKVKLTAPDITIYLEIEKDKLRIVKRREEGVGGFPTGTQEDVISLISGGFDSSVASYMLIRRGCRVHYCFFNLGGAMHEIGVKQTACYIWQRYASSHKVRFITLDFSQVVEEILNKVDDGQMGVILKRMMIRAASRIAQRFRIEALVTGEALGQVSSQTLTNLRLIDNVSDTLILRPLIAYDKEAIIKLSRQIGTEDLAKTMPEFCAVISKSPTVKAVKTKIEAEEAKFNFAVLEQAVTNATNVDIREIVEQIKQQVTEIAIVSQLTDNDIIIDIRAPEEEEASPLQILQTKIIKIPFYRLALQFGTLPQDRRYLLYCRKGVMSQLQALYLQEKGFVNVSVYRYES